MKKIIFTCALFLFTNAYANQSCSDIENDTGRLACYDKQSIERQAEKKTKPLKEQEVNDVIKLVATMAEVNEGTKVAAAPNWAIKDTISPIDDSRLVVLTTFSENDARGRYSDRKATMIIRCAENTTEMYFVFPSYLGSQGISTIYRVDKEKAVKTKWGASSDGEAVFARSPISVIKNLLGKNSLFLSVTPYASSPVDVTFDITGLEESIKPLREACDW